MFTFQLIDRRLLQIVIDRQAHVFIAGEFDRLSSDYFEGLRQGAALNTKERAFESGVAEVAAKEVGHGFVHRIVSIDVTGGIAPVQGQSVFEFAATIEQPAAQGRF